jgi:Tol biopolymer transport system component
MFRRLLLPLAFALLIAGGGALAASLEKPTEGRSNVFPVWSPDSTRVAFVADAPGPNNHDLWVVRADGTGFVDLTPDDLNEGAASWSPDGTRIAFGSAPTLTPGTTAVEIVNADGTDRHVVAPGGKPAWSPDGKRIAYFADDGVHVMNPDGTDDRFVARTDDAGLGDAPWSTVSWSPDSSRLAYIRGTNVFVVNADGSDERKLSHFGTPVLRVAASPSWSPDGTTIAFVVVGPATAPQPQDIWDVHPDGSGLKRLSSYGFLDSGASWTPDSHAIVYAAAKDRDGDVEIYSVDPEGGTPVDISNDRVWDEDPVVSPDGNRLAFIVRYGAGFNSSDLWTLDLATGSRRNLSGSAPGLTVDARTVKPPNKLVLRSVAAGVDRSFGRPILRVDVHVQDVHRDDVENAIVSVTTRARGLRPLRVRPSDIHGHAQWAARALNGRALRRGTRITLTLTVHPKGSYSRGVIARRRFVVRV